MKRANTDINFAEDKVIMFGEEQDVIVTISGHYSLPLNKARTILKNIDNHMFGRLPSCCGEQNNY